MDHAVACLVKIREGLSGRLCPVGICSEEACPIRRIKYKCVKNHADRSLCVCEVCCGDNRAACPVALILCVKRAIVAVYEAGLILCAERRSRSKSYCCISCDKVAALVEELDVVNEEALVAGNVIILTDDDVVVLTCGESGRDLSGNGLGVHLGKINRPFACCGLCACAFACVGVKNT